MKSSKCPNCSLVQWTDNNNCKRCGTLLDVPATIDHFGGAAPSSDRIYQSMGTQQFSNPTYGQQQLKSGLAIASMVLAIVSFPTMFLLIGLLLAPAALVMGIVALIRANRKPTIYGGKGFAIAGISVASVVCVFFVPLIAAIAIPNILAARRAANEGSAYNSLQKIASAQEQHSSMDDSGDCGDTFVLARKNLIPGELATGKKNGYRFVAGGNVSQAGGCEVRATPESKSEGNRAFYFSSADGVVRVTTRGVSAGPNDPPLETDSRASR